MAKQPVPAKLDSPGGSLGAFERRANELNAALNPFSGNIAAIGQLPFYSSGARSFIKIGGKPMGVCLDFRYKVAYQANPIVTIDSLFPWDISMGPVMISASLNKIVDPTKGPEVDCLLPIMESAAHHPYVELQVLDALGTSIFFARGMFVGVDGNIAKGQLSSQSAQFVGVAYQHYVAQNFKPYSSFSGGVSGIVKSLANLASDATGGFL